MSVREWYSRCRLARSSKFEDTIRALERALHFEKEIMDDVAELKKEFGSVCNVTTSFLARKPVDQYASFYDYYVRSHQITEGEQQASGRIDGE